MEDDAELVTRLRAGDSTVFEALFRTYYDRLVAFGSVYAPSAEVARDAVCEVFVTLFERRATLSVTSTVRGYLFRAVRNQILYHARSARREAARYATLEWEGDRVLGGETLPAPDVTLITQEDHAAIRAKVRAALATLSPRARLVVTLRIGQELSFDEIAEVLETTNAAVQMQLSRALKALRSQLSEILDDD